MHKFNLAEIDSGIAEVLGKIFPHVYEPGVYVWMRRNWGTEGRNEKKNQNLYIHKEKIIFLKNHPGGAWGSWEVLQKSVSRRHFHSKFKWLRKNPHLVNIHSKIYFKRYDNYLNGNTAQPWTSDITGLGKRTTCSLTMPQQTFFFFFFQNQDRSKTFKKLFVKQEADSPTPECFCCPSTWKHSYKQWKGHQSRKSKNFNLPLPLNSWLFPKAVKFSSFTNNFHISTDL